MIHAVRAVGQAPLRLLVATGPAYDGNPDDDIEV
jgi:hypothetical protein